MIKIISAFLRFLFQNRWKAGSLQVIVSNGQFRLSQPENRVTALNGQELIAELEKDIDHFWRTVPFHSIFLMYELPIENSRFGGTCTDRAVYFYDFLKSKYQDRLNIRLHRASIKGKETHTIILATISGKPYLIDVGANWPVMKLIPCFTEFEFNAFGIRFYSKPNRTLVEIFMQRAEDSKPQKFLTVDMTPQSTEYVDEQISRRFDPDKQLPFAKGLRYAAVHGDTFYFLKQDNVMHEDSPFSIRTYKKLFRRSVV